MALVEGASTGEELVGKVPVGEIPLGNSLAETPSAGISPVGISPVREAPVVEAPVGEAPVGEVPVGKAPNREAPIGEELIGSTSTKEGVKFPPEEWKALLAAIILFLSFLFTSTSLALVHDNVPNRQRYTPLPDVFLDNFPALDWALDVCEYILMITLVSTFIIMLLHKHRFIIFRRLFLIMSLLYLYRGITMFVTVLPVSSRTYYCLPKSNVTTTKVIAKRVIHVMTGFGFSVYGNHHYCGDFIYSGHTVMLILSYLFIAEYTPRKMSIVRWVYWILAAIGVLTLQLSHGHYTVDVLIAYFITTRTFWAYHALANRSCDNQPRNNFMGRSFWYGVFKFFENNIDGPVPREWPDWPFSWVDIYFPWLDLSFP